MEKQDIQSTECEGHNISLSGGETRKLLDAYHKLHKKEIDDMVRRAKDREVAAAPTT